MLSGLPLAILLLGAISVLLLVGSDWIRDRLILHDVGRIYALGEIHRRIATSHLWLEELVTGDAVPAEEIFHHLERSRELAAVLLDGGRVGEGRYPVAPFRDPDLRQRVQSLAEKIDRFELISQRRREGYGDGSDDVGIGSALDVEYDRVFHQLTAEALALDVFLSDRMIGNHARSRLLFQVLLFAWCGAILAAVWGLGSRERRRLAAEQKLARSREELFQARKLEAVGRLTGGIAHDINNYLAAISAQCERLLLKASPEPAVAERLERVIATAFKASALIRRLLAFSRRQPLRAQVVYLNEVIIELDKMMTRAVGEDIPLSLDLDSRLWPVTADPSQLEQVIVNLVINARDAMPTGGRLTLRTTNQSLGSDNPQGLPAGDYVRLSVSDTGVGIPEEIRDKIFEPFFTTRQDSGGSGLGLATVYGIVSQGGGAIRVDSAPGQGSTFTLWWPRGETDGVTLVPSDGSDDALAGGSESILLIDDNDDFRDSTASVLTGLGYRVTAVSRAAEARRLLQARSRPFALVVSDVVMPEESGPEVVAWIRRRWPGQRVLYMSGSPDRLISDHGLRRGEFEVLEKPFTSHALARQIRQILEGEGVPS